MSTNSTAGAAPAMRPALRWALLASGGIAAVVAGLPEDPAKSDAVVAMPARAAAQRAATSAAAASAAPAAAGAAWADAHTGTPWPPLSRAAQAAWVPLPTPRVAPAASAASVVVPAPTPGFPYQWIGQIDEAGRLRVFLADAQRLWAVAPGETVEPGWRVDGVDANGLQLTWLATGAAVQIAARP